MQKERKSILIIILLLFISSCGEKKEPCPIFFPLKPNAKLNFISYVTNQRNEILYPFEYHERRYIYADTIGTRIIHHYLERNNRLAFFIDDSCTIWNQIKIDLSALSVGFGFKYQDSVYFAYWKPMIKTYAGVGTRWKLVADTLFSAIDANGNNHLLKYHFSGNARYQGWTKVIVPENRTKELSVRHVQWSQSKYFLYDQTTGDTLIIQNAQSNDYFDPELGFVRSATDYTVKSQGKPKTFQKSTLELYSKLIL